MDLDFLQKIVSILGSLSLVVALSAYLHKKNQDEILATIEQISFFREKIIYEWDSVSKLIREKYPRHSFCRVKIDPKKNSIKDLREGDSSVNFNQQLDIFFKDSSLILDSSILDRQIFLLNMLEEFSLRIKHHKTQNHPALNSIKGTFVELVEKNAAAIIFMRDIITSNPIIYSSLLSLYFTWRVNFKKTNFTNNLEKNGFISKERKKEILKKQRENFLLRTKQNNMD